MPHNFLLACWGVAGNLGPMLTAARQLRRHGHRVRCIADAEMQEEIEMAGFGCAAWRRAPSYSELTSAMAALDASDLSGLCDRVLFGPAAAYAADTREELDRAPTDVLLLAISSAFDFPVDYLPKNVRYVGPLLDPPGWSKPWTAPWSQRSERPRALVSFSTSFQDQSDPLQRVSNALGRIEIDAVVTTGPALEGATLHAPKNVTLLHSAPHDAVMKEASLVITHGGHGTVSRALIHGLPLLVMPMGRDQNDNALRVETRGAGLSLPPGAPEAEIAAAVERLIGELHFRIAAKRLGEAIATDLNSGGLVREMEVIAMARRPAGRVVRERALLN